MKHISIQDLKTHGASVVADKGPTYLINNSKVKGVFLPLNEYEALVEVLQDYEDLVEAKKRISEPKITEKDFWKLANKSSKVKKAKKDVRN